MENKVLEYSGSAKARSITVNDNGTAYLDSSGTYPLTNTHNKNCYIVEGSETLRSVLNAEIGREDARYVNPKTIKSVPKKGDTLFFSSSCKLPRDIARQSGFNVTYKVDKADYIVTPDFNENAMTEITGNVLIMSEDGKNLTVVKITRNRWSKYSKLDNFCDEEIKAITECLDNIIQEKDIVYHEDDYSAITCYFYPKIDEFKDIVLGVTGNNKYIASSYVNLDSVSKIDVETMNIWLKMEGSMLRKSIVNSNWNEYPHTIYALIQEQGADEMSGDIAFDTVLRVLRDKKYEKNISVKDWNMFQKLLMILCGVPENGGLAIEEKVKSLEYENKFYLNMRYAIKPYFIEGEDEDRIDMGLIRSQFK